MTAASVTRERDDAHTADAFILLAIAQRMGVDKCAVDKCAQVRKGTYDTHLHARCGRLVFS
jgi:hypothetical protein